MNLNYYSSLRFEINGELKQDIVDWGLNCVDDEDIFHHIDYPYIGREENTHCTVLYNIIDTAPEQVQKVLAGEPSFEIELGEISIFESILYDVFKINVSGNGLHRLYRVATNSLNHHSFQFDFNPHLTIAFMKRHKGKQLLEGVNKNKFMGRKFKVEKLCFNKYHENETIINLTI